MGFGILEKTEFCKHTSSAKDYILVLLILDTTSQLLESLLYLHKLNLKGSEAPVILSSPFCSNKWPLILFHIPDLLDNTTHYLNIFD